MCGSVRARVCVCVCLCVSVCVLVLLCVHVIIKDFVLWATNAAYNCPLYILKVLTAAPIV